MKLYFVTFRSKVKSSTAVHPKKVLSSLSTVAMSLTSSPDEGLPPKVLDEREPIVSNLKQAFPADVRMKVSDGEVWASKALLSASSEYFSAMLDEGKFKEGKEGVGSLKKYSKEVVSKVINYFYSGEMSCQVKFVNFFCQCLKTVFKKLEKFKIN